MISPDSSLSSVSWPHTRPANTRAAIAGTARSGGTLIRDSFMRLPVDMSGKLHHAGGAAGIARTQQAVVRQRNRVIRIVQNVEEIDLEPEFHSLSDLECLEQRS